MKPRIPDIPYHRYAELIGLGGIFVDDPPQVGEAWQAAISADHPVVLEVKTDPEVPPLPPHINFKQMKSMTQALWKGDPDGGGVVKGTARQVMSSILPSKS